MMADILPQCASMPDVSCPQPRGMARIGDPGAHAHRGLLWAGRVGVGFSLSFWFFFCFFVPQKETEKEHGGAGWFPRPSVQHDAGATTRKRGGASGTWGRTHRLRLSITPAVLHTYASGCGGAAVIADPGPC